ncbi:peptidoglycan DD-metalloendopeptidase family protein [Sphingorhabdus sp.]|jgi:murein DD-endopeptidase MepM/ murein hydrolase activator NlpD|uniref:peptidoglycan DD-metalloendopeptidase family protein n=1 Tax=Sphingorhabdus sp. TaxID=1902408 RepID=UPI003BB1C739|nr:M23 family metallopeptidase [Sphingomonadales bacterium]MBK9430886.1 M23 family metallopeptidase [Sphingomonadales bacterium]MBL0021033.1 M23 family metallopeptidase [Sphingomonadales bacterium]
MRSLLIVLTASALASGCIPRGGEDYRIRSGSSSENPDVDATANPRAPVIVPEREIVEETPSWSPAAVQNNARRVDAAVYIVQPGDSLFAIANKSGAGATAIAEANGLTPPYMLKAGQRLNIPGGLFHRVGAGETGIAIARAYGVSWTDVVSLNKLPPPYVLQVGQNLRLPDGAAAVPVTGEPSPEQRAASFSLNIDDIVTGGQPAQASLPALPPIAANFAGAFGWPVNGTLVSRYGSQGGGRVNDGINIGAGEGAPVASAGDGVVAYAGNEIGVYGGLVLIDHGGGWVTAYGHLGTINVARGDRIKRGQLLGGVGDTGYVDTPQLHFEIRKDRKPLDPLTKLPARS